MRSLSGRAAVALLVLTTAFATFGPTALGPAPADARTSQEIDQEVPPGNPVVGSNAPGDSDDGASTDYGLLAIIALGLIAIGALLIRVERWERSRTEAAGSPMS